MTMPPGTDGSADGITAQVLIKLGEIATDVAVIKATLAILPDHEQRIRAAETELAKQSGSRDLTSRVFAAVAVLASIAAIVSVWLHK